MKRLQRPTRAAGGTQPGDWSLMIAGALGGFRQVGPPVNYVLRRDPHTHIHLLTGQNLNPRMVGAVFRAHLPSNAGAGSGCSYAITTPWHPVSGECPAGMPPTPIPQKAMSSFPPGRIFFPSLLMKVSAVTQVLPFTQGVSDKGS